MEKGFLSIILHAHLPYVRHPEHESFLEEIWLFEAITECYIPLINVLDRLQKDKVNFRLTLSLSPTLISMLSDDLLQSRYQLYLKQRIELAEKEIVRTRHQPSYQKLARLYRRFFLNAETTYKNQYQCNLLSAFKKHHHAGHLELITTAATHGLLPLLNINETAVKAQINIGIKTFESHLGFSPSGFWLPECGYYSGLENLLADYEIQYFFTDTHAVADAAEVPKNGVYAPLDCGNEVTAFARDPESSQQVWNAQEGYPGNANYREYYSDIGFDLDLDLDYLAPYILDKTTRINTGIKYHRVSNKGQEKELYHPKKARLKATKDAEHFILNRQQQINKLAQTMSRTPIVVSPYDAELFGHWWAEGSHWLETVFRLADNNNNGIQSISCKDYLIHYPKNQVSAPSFSTWGDEGYSKYWINEENDWIYPLLHQAAEELEQLVQDFSTVAVLPLQERILNQAVRSVLLAQASDWPFIIKSGTHTEYAKKKITDHLARFNYLHESIRNNNIDEHYLLALESMDNIFPDIDYRDYTSFR